MAHPTNEKALMLAASALAGRTLGDIAHEQGVVVPNDLKRAKGWVGELFESALGASAGSRPVPDFEDLGIELKSLPLNNSLEFHTYHPCIHKLLECLYPSYLIYIEEPLYKQLEA